MSELGEGVPKPQQEQPVLSPEARRDMQRMDVYRKRMTTKEDGTPRSPEESKAEILNAQVESLTKLADLLRRNAEEGTPIDPEEVADAVTLSAIAQAEEASVNHPDDPSVPKRLADVPSKWMDTEMWRKKMNGSANSSEGNQLPNPDAPPTEPPPSGNSGTNA